MKLTIISFFLSLLMIVQMMPIFQIGTMLSTNRWAEEIPNSCEQSSKGDVSVTNYLPPDQHMLVSAYCDATALLFLHISEQIPSNHSFDVVSPLPMQ
jgi:hypothetical protein